MFLWRDSVLELNRFSLGLGAIGGMAGPKVERESESSSWEREASLNHQFQRTTRRTGKAGEDFLYGKIREFYEIGVG